MLLTGASSSNSSFNASICPEPQRRVILRIVDSSGTGAQLTYLVGAAFGATRPSVTLDPTERAPQQGISDLHARPGVAEIEAVP